MRLLKNMIFILYYFQRGKDIARRAAELCGSAIIKESPSANESGRRGSMEERNLRRCAGAAQGVLLYAFVFQAIAFGSCAQGSAPCTFFIIPRLFHKINPVCTHQNVYFHISPLKSTKNTLSLFIRHSPALPELSELSRLPPDQAADNPGSHPSAHPAEFRSSGSA